MFEITSVTTSSICFYNNIRHNVDVILIHNTCNGFYSFHVVINENILCLVKPHYHLQRLILGHIRFVDALFLRGPE